MPRKQVEHLNIALYCKLGPKRPHVTSTERHTSRGFLLKTIPLVDELFDMGCLASQSQWHDPADVHIWAVYVHV